MVREVVDWAAQDRVPSLTGNGGSVRVVLGSNEWGGERRRELAQWVCKSEANSMAVVGGAEVDRGGRRSELKPGSNGSLGRMSERERGRTSASDGVNGDRVVAR